MYSTTRIFKVQQHQHYEVQLICLKSCSTVQRGPSQHQAAPEACTAHVLGGGGLTAKIGWRRRSDRGLAAQIFRPRSENFLQEISNLWFYHQQTSMQLPYIIS